MSILSRNTTFVDGVVLSASDLHTEFDHVYDGLIPSQLEDDSSDLASMQQMADPTTGSLASDLRGEIRRLRYKIDEMQGTTHWYTDAPDDLTNLNSTIATLIAGGSDAWIDTSHTTATMWGAGLSQSSDSITVDGIIEQTSLAKEIKVKNFPLGTWDMDLTQFINITHGLTPRSVYAAYGIVFPDTDEDLDTAGGMTFPVTITSGVGHDIYTDVQTSTVRITRHTNGYFDSTKYDSSYDRGYLMVWYEGS